MAVTLPSLGRRLEFQAIVAFMIKGIGAAFSFLLSWFIARRFGAAGSGQFGLVLATVQLCGFVAIAGADQVLMRTLARDAGNWSSRDKGVVLRYLTIVGLHGLCLSLLLFVFSTEIATSILSSASTATALAIGAWIVLPSAIGRIVTATWRSMGSVTRAMAIDGPVQTALTIMALGAALVLGLEISVIAALGALLASYLGVVLIALVRLLLEPRSEDPGCAPTRDSYSAIYAACAPILFVTVMLNAVEWLSSLMIADRMSLADVGIYRTAWQIVAVLGLVQTAFDSVVGPRIAAAWKAKRLDEAASVTLRMSGLAIVLSSPLALIVAIFPQRLLSIFGPEFTSGSTALQILMASQIIRLVAGPIGGIVVMAGKKKWIYLSGVLNLICFVAFSVPLIGGFGIEGVAIAVLLSVLTRASFTIWVAQSRLCIPLTSALIRASSKLR